MPSGYLSDLWGRRSTLRAAFICLAVSMVGIALSGVVEAGEGYSLPQFPILSKLGIPQIRICHKWVILFLAQFFRASGSALFSGTDMALLYETLKKYGELGSKDGDEDDDETKHRVKEEVLAIESYHVFAAAVTEAFFSALGGVLAGSGAFGLRGAVFASCVPFGLSAILCTLLEKDTKIDNLTTKTTSSEDSNDTQNDQCSSSSGEEKKEGSSRAMRQLR
eukprot:3776313-Ditylum_brightwellii.AAC.1